MEVLDAYLGARRQYIYVVPARNRRPYPCSRIEEYLLAHRLRGALNVRNQIESGRNITPSGNGKLNAKTLTKKKITVKHNRDLLVFCL